MRSYGLLRQPVLAEIEGWRVVGYKAGMRIVARLLVLLPLLWVEGVGAVDCESNSYSLTTQAEVDALGASGCDRVLGQLAITWSNTDITNIDGLANLTSIGTSLLIQNTDLTDLEGLTNLTHVGGQFLIWNNDALTDITGLNSLVSVGDRLSISFNDALTGIMGLNSLTSVEGKLEIHDNLSLASIEIANLTKAGGLSLWRNRFLSNLDGLSSLASIEGSLELYYNNRLTDIDGLANVTSFVGGYINIKYNDALTNLGGLAHAIYSNVGGVDIDGKRLTEVDGLINLTSVRSWVTISGSALKNIDGLANLTSVGGDLAIGGSSLTDLDGLASLTSVGGSLTIAGCAALTNLDGLASLTNVGGEVTIRENNALTSISGLPFLAGSRPSLTISGNAALTDLDGLTNLTKAAHLSIESNATLVNLDGLVNLIDVVSLKIEGNSALTDCQGIAPVLGWPSGPPDDLVEGAIDIRSNALACNSVEDILSSVSEPTRPVISSAAVSGQGINIAFSPSNATHTPFFISGYEAKCMRVVAELNESPAISLLDNTPVTRTFGAERGVASDIEVDIDITHNRPEHLHITLTAPEGTQLILWDRGGAGTNNMVGTFPTTLTPVDSFDLVIGQAVEGNWMLYVEDVVAGPLVKEGILNSWGLKISEELIANDSGSPIEVLGAARGESYSCSVAPISQLGKTSTSDYYAVYVPFESPDAPNITSTDYEDGKIILTVSVSDNGGTDITGYDATCTDGTNAYTGTSTSSPITVSGLTNDVPYTCTVTATNSVGTSSASAATAPITPEETSTGLPIWLLYQATQ